MGGIEAHVRPQRALAAGRPRALADARARSPRRCSPATTFLPASHLNVSPRRGCSSRSTTGSCTTRPPTSWDLGDGMALPKALHAATGAAFVSPRDALVGRVAALRDARPAAERACAPTAASCVVDDALLEANERAAINANASEANMWVGLALLHIALRARAQRDRRAAARGLPQLRRRRALRQGAADQLGADGEDPHGRVDAGDHRPPDDREGDPRDLVRAARRAACGGASGASASARSVPASRARGPTTTASRTRSPRSS